MPNFVIFLARKFLWGRAPRNFELALYSSAYYRPWCKICRWSAGGAQRYRGETKIKTSAVERKSDPKAIASDNYHEIYQQTYRTFKNQENENVLKPTASSALVTNIIQTAVNYSRRVTTSRKKATWMSAANGKL